MEVTTDLDGVNVSAYMYVDRGDPDVGMSEHPVVEDVFVEVTDKQACIDRWGTDDEYKLKDIIWDYLYENFHTYVKPYESWDRF